MTDQDQSEPIIDFERWQLDAYRKMEDLRQQIEENKRLHRHQMAKLTEFQFALILCMHHSINGNSVATPDSPAYIEVMVPEPIPASRIDHLKAIGMCLAIVGGIALALHVIWAVTK